VAKTQKSRKQSQAKPAKRVAKTGTSASRRDGATRSGARTGTSKEPVEAAIPPEAIHLHDAEWLAGQREALLRERANYTISAERLAAEAAALMADREPGDVQFDEESGEGDTIAVERDRDLALSAAARQAVTEIDRALTRLDGNTYGLCIVGNDVIPKERLEAIPEASVCVQHKTSMF
jgi:RNA polymerase-binding transcription factor DksA